MMRKRRVLKSELRTQNSECASPATPPGRSHPHACCACLRIGPGGLTLLLLLLSFHPLEAQDKLLPVFHFQQLSTATGLSSNLIGSQVVRDRNGFIWVGTLAGLDRYDGYSVKQYRNVPGDPHSLPSNIVYALALDNRERLWVGTYGSGLCVYDPTKDGFVNLHPRAGDSSWYSAKGIYAIREDRAGNLWLGTEEGGVVSVELPGSQGTDNLDSLAGKIRMTTYHLGTFRNIAHDLCIWNDGRIFVGSDSGIVVINPESHATSRLIPHNPFATLLDSILSAVSLPTGRETSGWGL